MRAAIEHAAVQLDHVVPVAPLQRDRLGRDVDAGAELLRLDDGSAGQLRAGDPRGEAQVVLDPGRGPRLAARRHRIQHDGGQALRGAVDGGGQPGRAGADDDQVAGDRARARVEQADAAGQLGVARVAQHLLPPPDHHRRVLGLDTQLAEQLLGLLVPLQVDPAVRQEVAGGELQQPPGVGREARADDPEANTELDQDRAADEIGPQHQVAEGRVLGDQLAQALHRHGQDLAGLLDHRRQQRGLVGEQAQLAEEPAGPVHGDHPLGPATLLLDDRHRPREDHEEVVVLVALPVEDLAWPRGSPLAVGGQGLQLLVAQPRVRPLEVRCLGQRRRVGRGHVHHPVPPPAGVQVRLPARRSLPRPSAAGRVVGPRRPAGRPLGPGAGSAGSGCPARRGARRPAAPRRR